MTSRAATQYVAFLRAINVAGHATVRMDDLRIAFAAAGCSDVRTCIQSGNVIFESPPDDIAAVLQRVRARRKARPYESATLIITGPARRSLPPTDRFQAAVAGGEEER